MPATPTGAGNAGLKRLARHPLFRGLLLLALLLLAVWVIAPEALDLPSLWGHFRSADPAWLTAAVLAQVARYAGAGLLMTLSARAAGVNAPPGLSSQAALASGAAARIIPFGGAGGIAVRAAYLSRRGMHEAAIAGYFVLQNLLGTAWLLATVLLALLLGAGAGQAGGWGAILPLVVASLLGTALVAYLMLRPERSAALAASLGRRLDSLVRSRGRRSSLEEALPRILDQAAAALRIGSVIKFGLLLAAFFSSWTILGDMASLHFSVWSLGVRATVPHTVLAYTAASLAGSAVGMPYGMGVTEGAMLASYSALGYDLDRALSAVLVFRALSFWLAIPLGLLAAANLRRVRAL